MNIQYSWDETERDTGNSKTGRQTSAQFFESLICLQYVGNGGIRISYLYPSFNANIMSSSIFFNQFEIVPWFERSIHLKHIFYNVQ